MSKLTIVSFVTLMVTSTLAAAQSASETPINPSIFPPAKPGDQQHIITIPKVENEGFLKLEIIAGRTMEVDCNHILISADLDDETLKGWGYNYYKIDDISQAASTLMACPDDRKREEFVPFNLGKDALVRYNSKLPLVLYAPKDVEVGYRVWTTDGKIEKSAN